MRRLRRATWDEVVVAWLQAEERSPRFGHHLHLGDVDRRIIERPDLIDPTENALRRRRLAYRDDILTTIPAETEWWAAELAADDLADLFAINYPAWEVYSSGTGRLLKVAEAVRDGLHPTAADPTLQDGISAIRENVGGIYHALSEGKTLGPLVLIGGKVSGPFTVIEGNKRAAALCWRHCLDVVPWPGIASFVGITLYPNPWLSPHAESSPSET